jgi:hypothetical protein
LQRVHNNKDEKGMENEGIKKVLEIPPMASMNGK